MSTPPNTGSPSPSQDLTPLQITALQALPAPPTQPSTNPRRLPPPCWTPDETVALIDAYRDKWYTLRRGNLKANHWQEVADAVALAAVPAQHHTHHQNRCAEWAAHKMETLRKRYPNLRSRGPDPCRSRGFDLLGVHFKRMGWDGKRGTQAKGPD
ncbi:hypothetical protein POTOM_046322 [Populus tomentosa]|uniref:Myb/SANT-like DNA-binding domain-containing protein n=1 Tax=Populus tomentosa TaxID=118781 RepID=A0A8X7YE72_POPTO|nr:hypothetical protein POTOM_046322 [Populus tomentosa]